MISYASGMCLKEIFSALVVANAHDPGAESTRLLKVRFIKLLADLGVLSKDLSVQEVCSLLEPPWVQSALSKRNMSPILPKSSDDNNATLWLCSMAGAGYGFILPPFLLPRPRLVMQWRGFYPESSAVSVAEMATGRGVIARGTQVGTSFGFIGVGFAFAVPGAPAEFGFIGYSLLTKLQGADMTWYYANFPPLVMDMSPEDGAVNVPTSLSELTFTLKDYDFDTMTYNVVTSPNIGSGANTNVDNGVYHVPVSGLDGGTTYTWTVTVTDGTDTVENAFTFTTEMVAPIISEILPMDDSRYVPVTEEFLRFHLSDPQNDLMSYTVETSPFIGSGSGSGVSEGDILIPVSGLDYMTEYRWFVNVTDGLNPVSKMFRFQTEPIMVFDPFAEGWGYRKMITIDHTKVAGDLQFFPVLLSLTDTDLRDKAQNDGDDILFMDDTGVATRMYHELEEYDDSSGRLVAWVNVSALSSTVDTTLYMYYGNTDSSDQQCPEKTWDANYEAVWHMNDASLTTISDSTSHKNTGTKIAPYGPQQTTGKCGSGQNFDGTDDGLDYTSSIIPTGPKTISVWIKKASDNSGGETMFASSTGGSWNDEGTATFFSTSDDGLLNWYMGNGASYSQFLSVRVLIPDRTLWHLYTMIYDGSSLTMFTDAGSPISNFTKSGTESDPTYTLRIGIRPINDYCAFHGTLDEFKISNIARSYEYIATEYNNQNEPTTFLTIGPEEPHP